MRLTIEFSGGPLFGNSAEGRRIWRSIAHEVIKGGIVSARKARSIASTIAEESKQLVAEARAELDAAPGQMENSDSEHGKAKE
jgi:hypothetical protein